MMFRMYTLLILLSSMLLACQGQVNEQDFKAMLDQLYEETVPLVKTQDLPSPISDLLILDTREEEEYLVSHLPGAVWVGYDDFQSDKLKGIDKNQDILVYCSVGYRSERIGEKLQEMGFKRVQNLYGGIFDWVNHGEEVLDAQEIPTHRVHTYNRLWSKWLFKGEKVF